jgi:hypothetical protein
MSYMTTHRPDCAGKSLLEMLWDQLMEAYADLMTMAWQRQEYADHPDDHAIDLEEFQQFVEDHGKAKGACLGLATAIAIITNPYAPDVDAVRAEVAQRHEAMG